MGDTQAIFPSLTILAKIQLAFCAEVAAVAERSVAETKEIRLNFMSIPDFFTSVGPICLSSWKMRGKTDDVIGKPNPYQQKCII